MNEDTLTEKDINDVNFDAEKSNLMSENKMEIQEPLNPFVQKNMQNFKNSNAATHKQNMNVYNNIAIQSDRTAIDSQALAQTTFVQCQQVPCQLQPYGLDLPC